MTPFKWKGFGHGLDCTGSRACLVGLGDIGVCTMWCGADEWGEWSDASMQPLRGRGGKRRGTEQHELEFFAEGLHPQFCLHALHLLVHGQRREEGHELHHHATTITITIHHHL